MSDIALDLMARGPDDLGLVLARRRFEDKIAANRFLDTIEAEAKAEDPLAEIKRVQVGLQQRWERTMAACLKRFIERKLRLVEDKARTVQFRRDTVLWDPPGATPLSTRLRTIIDEAAWERELTEELDPLLRDLYAEAIEALPTITTKGLPDYLAQKVEAFVGRWTGFASSVIKGFADVIARVLGGPVTFDSEVGPMVRVAVEESLSGYADRVATSLATGGVNQAQNEAATVSPVTVEKTWFSANDTRVRRGHRLANGQTVPVAEHFTVEDHRGMKHRMLYPGDISAPPELWINCRCVNLYTTRASESLWAANNRITDPFGGIDIPRKALDMLDRIEAKKLPVDGDGDGRIYDGTPWERPAPARAIERAVEGTVRNGGITIRLSNRSPRKGFAFAVSKDVERVIPLADFTEADVEAYVEEFADLLAQPGNHLGTWVDDGKVYLDISKVGAPTAKTLAEAQSKDQLAVFDLDSFETLYLGTIEDGVYQPLGDPQDLLDQYRKDDS